MAILARLIRRSATPLILAATLLALPATTPAQIAGREAPQQAGREAPQQAGREAPQQAGREAPQQAGREAPHQAGREVQIFGVSDEVADELREEVRDLIVPIEGGNARAADVADISYTMEQNLRGRGFAEARVEYRMFRITEDGTTQPVRTAAEWPEVRIVAFHITAGKLTWFGTISFSGNNHFSAAELGQYVPVAGAPTPNVSRVPFEAQRINRGIRSIEGAYTLAGYVDVAVGPAVETIRDTGDGRFIDITIPIREGTRYFVRGITIDAPGLPPSVASGLESLSILGNAYFPRQAVIGETEIRRTLGSFGYRPSVTHTTDLDPAGGATIRYSLDVGVPRSFRSLIISDGEDPALRTRRRFVERLLPFQEGDTLDLLKIQAFEERLYDLGVFAFVDITEAPEKAAVTVDTEIPASEKSAGTAAAVPTDLVVTLREGRSRYIEVAAGWGSYELLRGRLNYTDNNLFGRALTWSTTGALSFRTRELSSSLTDRTLFGPSVRISLDGAYDYRDGPSYERTGAAAGITGYYELSDVWEADLAYRWSYTEARGVTAGIADQEDPELTTGRISGGVGADSRDSVLIPTRGQRGAVHGLLALPPLGSEIAFWGVEIEGATHHRITPGTYLSFRGEYRTRIALDDRRTLPIQERLFLGGAGSVRSFVQDRLGPGGSGGDPQGGLTSTLASIEIRQRLVGELFLAGFYDIGSVGTASWNVDTDIGSGIGLGLRYHLPIGPLRLDGAYNPGETFTQDRPWAIHFAVGFSF